MAGDDSLFETPEKWDEVGKHVGIGLVEAFAKANVGDSLGAVVADIAGKALALAFKAVVPIGVGLAQGIADAEDAVGPQLAQIAAAAASDVFGKSVPASAFMGGRGGNNARSTADALGAGLIGTLSGAAGEIQPGDDGAKKYLGMVVNMALEGWYQGFFFEFLSSLVPYVDVGKIESFGELDDTLSQALGLGRLSRRVLGPIVESTVVTPFQWQCNKTYRPNLLSEGEILKAFLRGDYTGGEVAEELGRLGYSDRRQDMLLKSAFKPIPLDDAMVLMRDGQVGRDYVIAALRAQGYDATTAEIVLRAAETRLHLSIQDDSLGAVRSAYANGRISESEFSNFLGAIVPNEDERAAHEIAARTIRDVNRKTLSPAEARACVKASVLPMAAYREALENDGYDLESALALELLLRVELDEKADVEELRRQQAAEREAERKRKADAAAAKQAELEAQRALARRGPLSELVRAAVIGLIPISRAVEVLQKQYDGDTVAIYVADIEQQRVEYLKQQEKANAVKKEADLRRIDVGSFEQAVLNDVISIDQFRRTLDGLKFEPADADVLTATLRARKADYDAAKAKRLAADSEAKKRSIDLGRFETLVRRGARSLADYDQLLASLAFDEPSRAAMRQLLQIQIDDDAKAAALRARVKVIDDSKGLSLEQFRRAVLLQVKTIDDFAAWLIAEKYTTDAQQVLVAELRDDVAEAEAARRKRDAPAPGVEPRALPLATVARAARLGIVPPSLYQQRLLDAGYTDDDIAIEMALLIQEIADVQAAREQQAAEDQAAEPERVSRDEEAAARAVVVAAPPPAPTLTLAQMAAAVRTGVKHLEDYRARVSELGLSNEDRDTLVRVLADELASSTAARARRLQLESDVKPGDVSLAELADQVRAGTLSLEAYVGRLDAAGLDPVDVDLLTSLLGDELAAG